MRFSRSLLIGCMVLCSILEREGCVWSLEWNGMGWDGVR